MKDWDLEGTKNVCMILIANIDRELCPSTVTQFLHRHTSVSARVLIFPNLSSEVHTRGAIILDSEKEFQKMCSFLNDPNCIITSSTGRYSACTHFLNMMSAAINNYFHCWFNCEK